MPISVSCPACGKEYNVKDEAAGKKFKCKECEAVVEVPPGGPQSNEGRGDQPVESENPFANLDFGGPESLAPPMPQRRSSAAGASDRSAALDRLAGPAVGMMITAGIGMLGVNGWLIMMVIGASMDQNAGAEELVLVFVVWGVILLGAMLLLCLVMYGALKMKRGESYGLALAASIIASIPCLTPCLCMPFGIWSLVVLSDNDVKSAFR